MRLLNNQRVEECHFSLPGQRIWAWPAYSHRVQALNNARFSKRGRFRNASAEDSCFFWWLSDECEGWIVGMLNTWNRIFLSFIEESLKQTLKAIFFYRVMT